MDYLCAYFGNFSFSRFRFGFNMRTDRQTETTVGVSNWEHSIEVHNSCRPLDRLSITLSP